MKFVGRGESGGGFGGVVKRVYGLLGKKWEGDAGGVSLVEY